ncbi:MAG: hypothetical protein SOT80_08045 [Candidatus Pseudoruminococcus sp.]|nr:hypothetical protein [Ruminococcus sp.]MDY2783328.1 hypothetical protein [Candidatus Pseudoruminococcus sp.]
MKTTATVMQVSRSLLILTPAEYDKPESTIQISAKKNNVPTPTIFGAPQIFELKDSLKDHPMQKSDELAQFVKRCAQSIGLNLGDVFVCIEDEDNVVSTEYTHPAAKEKMLPAYARVEAEKILHGDIAQYTIIHSEYGYQFGRAKKSEDLQAALFAMSSKTIADIKVEFEKEGIHVVKIIPPITALIHAGKEQMNSATKTVALISIDFVATRLVILHNGAPIFQQSFSSVLEDIAEMISLEFGISPLGAIDLIRENGLGVCDRCNDPNTRKQTMGMLDNAAGEVLRTLRMVISTQKVDIDQIVICDSLSKLSNLSNYCRSIGLTAPIENVSTIYTQGIVPPQVTEVANDKGYSACCYVTLNAILDMRTGEGNFLGGESGMAHLQKNSTLGGKIAAGAAIAVGLWMLVVGGWWMFLNIRYNNDQNALNDPILTETKNLLKDESDYQQKLSNLQTDKDLLPTTVVHVGDILDHVFDFSHQKLGALQNVNVSNSSNSISASIITNDFEQYVKLRDYIKDQQNYFDLSANMTSTRAESGNVTNTLSISVSADTIKKAKEEKDKEENNKETVSENPTTDKTDKTDKTQVTSTTEEASK